jgi:16S rRNA (uracil1498-N3)-methyltransferase
MKVRRFRVRRENIFGLRAIIDDPREVRHICKVLRLGEGDTVFLFDGEGKEYRASITGASPKQITLALAPEEPSPQAGTSLRILLGMALLKSSKFEWVLQKTTELGVFEVLPFSSSRVIPRRQEEPSAARLARWEKIVSEAARQCGRSVVPRVHPPRSFEELLQTDRGEATRIFLWEKEKTKSLGEALTESVPQIFLLVGPEGGFSDPEALRAEQAGFQPVRLGPRTLRAETAAIAGVTLLQFIRGDLGRQD